MTAKTITSSSSALTLMGSNYSTYNPLSITSTGTVTSSTASAIYSSTAKSWNIINYGTISSTKSTAGVGGIVLKQGGTITNGASGIISGELLGVYIAGSAGGSITNSGTIEALAATGVGVKITASNVELVNAGSIAAGATTKNAVTMSGSADVLMLDPGFSFYGHVVGASTDTLALGGTVATALASLGTSVSGFGTTTIEANAIWSLTGVIATTLINSGTLDAAATLKFNGASIVNNAVITGGELNLDTDPGNTLTNNGTITGATAGGAGAVFLYQSSIINNGTITGVSTNIHSSGVQTDNGTITNASGALISGAQGIYDISVGQATLVNSGTVIGTASGGDGAVALRAGGSVSNASGALIQGAAYGVFFQGATGGGSTAGFVTNQGSISGAAKYGVYLGYGGTITNAPGGRISGAGGVQIGSHAPGTLVNTGTVIGTTFYGVELQPGNTVINTTNGTAAGYIVGRVAGIRFVNGGTDSLDNFATIKGTGASSRGIYLANTYGTLTNGSGGLIQGVHFGVEEAYQTVTLTNLGTITGQTAFYAKDTFSGTPSSNTIINAGTIESTSGSAGIAIQFGAANDRLMLDPGAVFIGTVNGGGGTNTLELATGSGTLSALGSQITNFQTLLIDANSQWTLTGTPTFGSGNVIEFASDTSLLQFTPGSVAATFDGFATGDTIGLTGVADANGVSVVNTNTLEVHRVGNPAIYLTLNPAQTLTGATFQYATNGGNAFITAEDLACFAEDTRIDTATGPIPVQHLRVGDVVRTAAGQLRPIRWLGWRSLDLSPHSNPASVLPILIRKNAFADGIPCRDLRLSPDHAVRIEDVLVPIRLLVNGATILRDTAARSVTYYHIELESHDVLLAESLPAESYLDTGNRAMFENVALPLLPHPDPGNDQARRVAGSCLPLADDAARVEPLWRRLAERAARMGRSLPLAPEITGNTDLRVVVGDVSLRALRHGPDHHIFVLPPCTRTLQLVSRNAVPSERHPWVEDRRRLGVMIHRITLRGDQRVETFPLDHPSCRAGWWQTERNATDMWRWTNGNAELTLPDGLFHTLEIEASGMTGYPVAQSIATLSEERALALAS